MVHMWTTLELCGPSGPKWSTFQWFSTRCIFGCYSRCKNGRNWKRTRYLHELGKNKILKKNLPLPLRKFLKFFLFDFCMNKRKIIFLKKKLPLPLWKIFGKYFYPFFAWISKKNFFSFFWPLTFDHTLKSAPPLQGRGCLVTMGVVLSAPPLSRVWLLGNRGRGLGRGP